MQNILTINSGSSSLKFALFDENLNQILKGAYDRIGLSGTAFKITNPNADEVFTGKLNHKDCLAHLVNTLKSRKIEIHGVGHRVVHGGDFFTKPEKITLETLERIRSLTSLAPLHQPHNIAGIEAVEACMPTISQVAVFDTSFHTTQPYLNQLLPIPRKYYDEGVKSYGFHGLSYDYISRQSIIKNYERVVVAHLGNGSSACALLNNRSHASTMGFTAIDGLMMGTRTGALDPGVILHFMSQGMTEKEITDLLYKKSGLLGVSGLSSDVRELISASEDGNELATDALTMYADRVAGHIARLGTLLRGIDALVFTAGIGENSPLIRKLVIDRLRWIGAEIDDNANEGRANESRCISSTTSGLKVFVIPTNEEWVIANAVKSLK